MEHQNSNNKQRWINFCRHTRTHTHTHQCICLKAKLVSKYGQLNSTCKPMDYTTAEHTESEQSRQHMKYPTSVLNTWQTKLIQETQYLYCAM